MKDHCCCIKLCKLYVFWAQPYPFLQLLCTAPTEAESRLTALHDRAHARSTLLHSKRPFEKQTLRRSLWRNRIKVQHNMPSNVEDRCGYFKTLAHSHNGTIVHAYRSSAIPRSLTEISQMLHQATSSLQQLCRLFAALLRLIT